MTNKENRLSRLKYQLKQKKENGKKVVIWKLTKEQAEYVERFYQIKPVIFEVQTKSIPSIEAVKSRIVKNVHYAHKRGQKRMYCNLKVQERRELDRYDIHYEGFKYKIFL